MEILQAKPADLIEILYLLKVCILDMNHKGLKHWNNTYPGAERIRQDLAGGCIYLAKDRGVCKGMLTLYEIEPEDYKQVNFPQERQKPLYLQHMAVHPKWQWKGIAGQLMEFALKMARDRGCDSIRVDVFKSSDIARQFCEKHNFQEVASFFTVYQQVPYLCYERKL